VFWAAALATMEDSRPLQTLCNQLFRERLQIYMEASSATSVGLSASTMGVKEHGKKSQFQHDWKELDSPDWTDNFQTGRRKRRRRRRRRFVVPRQGTTLSHLVKMTYQTIYMHISKKYI
jgi:hypothetical protein